MYLWKGAGGLVCCCKEKQILIQLGNINYQRKMGLLLRTIKSSKTTTAFGQEETLQDNVKVHTFVVALAKFN